MKKKRPVYLNLLTMKFPVMAIVSILHRVSGFILFLAIPLFLWLLKNSLASFVDFVEMQSLLSSPFIKLLLFVLLSGLVYHLIAGIRHLIMDCGIGESLKGGRFGAWCVIALTSLCVLFIGVWLW